MAAGASQFQIISRPTVPVQRRLARRDAQVSRRTSSTAAIASASAAVADEEREPGPRGCEVVRVRAWSEKIERPGVARAGTA